MKMRANVKATVLLCSFFIAVFTVAFLFNKYQPALVIAGESSVGTWMSGVLLVMSATLCLVTGMQRGGYPWFILTVFFFVLACDERFMFHEQLKNHITFSFKNTTRQFPLVSELPVIAGACIGVLVTFMLWKHLHGYSRILLLLAVLLGSLSVVMDIFTAGVLIEESAKLFAELLITCALLNRVNFS